MNSLTWATSSPRRVRLPVRSGGHGLWLSGAVLLLTLSTASRQNITAVEFVYAGVLLSLSIQAYLSWRRGSSISIPVWALVCAAHFVFFGLAFFGPVRTSPSSFDHGQDVPDSAIAMAMLVGIVGLLSMGLGRIAAMYLAEDRILRLPFLEMRTHTPIRVRILLVLGIAANLLGVPFFGTMVWNISVIIFGTLPLAAFLWLVLSRNVRKLAQLDLLLAIAFVATRVVSSARFNASLGAMIVPLFLMSLAAVSPKRQLPWRMIGLVACVIVFLQPGKGAIRHEMYRGQVGEGATDAIVRWFEVAGSGWADVFSGRAALDEQLSATTSRTSLLTMTGLILDKTPETVPYQFGASYPLLFQNLIPRVFWPEKPSVNFANQFFQAEYGVTENVRLGSVSVACGFEAEGYMNFGWIGILAVGLLVGFAFGIYEVLCFYTGSGLAATAVGLALLPGFLTIESQLVQYLGGVLQFALAAGIVFHAAGGKRSSYADPGVVRTGRVSGAFVTHDIGRSGRDLIP